jgi:hypothetical protein
MPPPPGELAAGRTGEEVKMFYYSFVDFSKKENPDSLFCLFESSNVWGPPMYLAGKV